MVRLGAPFSVAVNPAGESTLGNLIADAQLAATRDAGAQLAFMNPGGVRSPLGGEGKLDVVYEEVFAVQPFYNQLITMTLSGEQVLQLLERMVSGTRPRPFHPSRGLSYSWDAGQPPGQRVLRDSVRLNGQPLTATQQLRVTVNSFLAGGGDDAAVLRQGQALQPGLIDVDALEAYLKANPGIQPDTAPRITRLN